MKTVVRPPPERLTSVALVTPPTLAVSLQWTPTVRRGRVTGTDWEQIDVIVTYGCGSSRNATPNVVAEFGVNHTDVPALTNNGAEDMPLLLVSFLSFLNDTLTIDFGLGLTEASYTALGHALRGLIAQRRTALNGAKRTL